MNARLFHPIIIVIISMYSSSVFTILQPSHHPAVEVPARPSSLHPPTVTTLPTTANNNSNNTATQTIIPHQQPTAHLLLNCRPFLPHILTTNAHLLRRPPATELRTLLATAAKRPPPSPPGESRFRLAPTSSSSSNSNSSANGPSTDSGQLPAGPASGCCDEFCSCCVPGE